MNTDEHKCKIRINKSSIALSVFICVHLWLIGMVRPASG
jgi:hypothetical protein